jgi:hypothetical protein
MPKCRNCERYEPAQDADKGYCNGQVVWGKRDAADCPWMAYRPTARKLETAAGGKYAPRGS